MGTSCFAAISPWLSIICLVVSLLTSGSRGSSAAKLGPAVAVPGARTWTGTPRPRFLGPRHRSGRTLKGGDSHGFYTANWAVAMRFSEFQAEITNGDVSLPTAQDQMSVGALLGSFVPKKTRRSWGPRVILTMMVMVTTHFTMLYLQTAT